MLPSLFNRLYFCSSEKFIGRALPEDVFQTKNSKVKSFLQTLYSSSPFATLFKDVPQSESFSTNSAATNSNKNIATFRHSKSDLEKLGSGQPQTFPGQLTKNGLPGKLMRKPPTGRQSSSVANLPPSGRHQLPGTRAGSNPSLLTQRVGSLGKLVVRDERDGVVRRGGDVIRWGSDHNLQTGDTPDIPWVVDESPSRSRNG